MKKLLLALLLLASSAYADVFYVQGRMQPTPDSIDTFPLDPLAEVIDGTFTTGASGNPIDYTFRVRGRYLSNSPLGECTYSGNWISSANAR